MWRDQESLILYLSMWYISSNIVVPFMLGVNIIWPRAGRSPANNLHSRFPYRLVLKLMPQDDIYRIIDQVSQQLSSHAEHYSTAEPSVTITHDTHYTHSVAVLNLSWQHSGKLLVFANFCPSHSKLPILRSARAHTGWQLESSCTEIGSSNILQPVCRGGSQLPVTAAKSWQGCYWSSKVNWG